MPLTHIKPYPHRDRAMPLTDTAVKNLKPDSKMSVPTDGSGLCVENDLGNLHKRISNGYAASIAYII